MHGRVFEQIAQRLIDQHRVEPHQRQRVRNVELHRPVAEKRRPRSDSHGRVSLQYSLAEALVRVLTDVDLRARLGAGGRRRFEERFDLATREGELADAYEGLVRARLEHVL